MTVSTHLIITNVFIIRTPFDTSFLKVLSPPPFCGWRSDTKTETYPSGDATQGGKLNGCRESLGLPKGKAQYRDFGGTVTGWTGQLEGLCFKRQLKLSHWLMSQIARPLSLPDVINL